MGSGLYISDQSSQGRGGLTSTRHVAPEPQREEGNGKSRDLDTTTIEALERVKGLGMGSRLVRCDLFCPSGPICLLCGPDRCLAVWMECRVGER
jgi:hypothetical protein